MKLMDFFVWQERSREFERHAARRRSGTGLQAGAHPARAGGVNSRLFTTSATQPGGKRRGFMARYGMGLVLTLPMRGCALFVRRGIDLHAKQPQAGYDRHYLEGCFQVLNGRSVAPAERPLLAQTV
jgi:hypothetical protein